MLDSAIAPNANDNLDDHRLSRHTVSATERIPEKRQKPKKPHPSFPLTAHANGQWCKRIRGRVHFFGVWADPEAALKEYKCQAADLHAGRLPQRRQAR